MAIRSVLAIIGLLYLGMFFVDNVDNNAYSQSPDRIVEQSCNTSADCTGGRVCVSNWCAECGNDSDCTRSNKRFCLTNSQYPKLNRCVECSSNEQCDGVGMICKASDHTCTYICTGGKILVSTKTFPNCSECAGTGSHERCTNRRSCPLGMLCATPSDAPQERTGYCIADCRTPTRFESPGEFKGQPIPFDQPLPKPGKGPQPIPDETQIEKYTAPDLPKQDFESGKPRQ